MYKVAISTMMAFPTISAEPPKTHTIALLEPNDTLSYGIHHSGDLVPRNARERVTHGAILHGCIRVADTACVHSHSHLSFLGLGDGHMNNFQICSWKEVLVEEGEEGEEGEGRT
eukprot:Phypoly_transcript_23623.p1 GENE.Phypoly_transcript_23623~~Phypoly_transcript_23623.p1  ORF type:complete len:114 (+),score=21.01 Phypoly_transcript_23623:110-451(+)